MRRLISVFSWEAPLINARLRKTYLATALPVATIGPSHELGYPVTSFGNDPLILEKILKGRHALSAALKEATYPMMIIGQGVLRREDGAALLHVAHKIAEKYDVVHHKFPPDHWNGFNVLHTAASRVGGLDLGLIPGPNGYTTQQILKAASTGKLKAVYLLGVDEIDLSSLKSTFVIYQGHHGDRGADSADVILPGAAYTEKSGTYVNTEGRIQRSLQALCPPGEAQEDWKILRALSDKLGIPLPYNTLEEVRQRLVEVNSIFEETDTVQSMPWMPFGVKGKISASPFEESIESFYMTDSISRHSVTMAQCQQDHIKRENSHDRNI